MNTHVLPVDPDSPPKAASPAPHADAVPGEFNPTHPELYLFHDDKERVDGLSIDTAPLPVLGTDAARGLG